MTRPDEDRPPADPALFQRRSIRAALKCWSSLTQLGDHPLAGLRIVAARRQAAGHADTPAGRGIALRTVLRSAMDELRPEGSQEPDFSQPRWRHYTILKAQFVDNRRARDLQALLGVSESGYFADQRQALDALADNLRLQETAVHAPLPSATAAQTHPAPPPSALPHPPNPFIGRETEQARIANLLAQPDSRLISIIGPGGMGKTRLALEAAHRQSQLPAYFVPLDTVETPEQLIGAIAQALRFTFDSFEPQEPAEIVDENTQAQLINFLRTKQLLLLLDNFEHLTRIGSHLLTNLLEQAPQVKVLLTSRERLNLRGEWLIDLRGLALPPLNSPQSDPRTFSAGKLFVQTLERVRSGRQLASDEGGVVADICHLVEGMPLGLELAASWGNMLSCAEIAVEIRRNLDFLQGTFSDLPQRHRSLRAVFTHSWELLNAAEKAVFIRLAVFRSGFERAAAEWVAEASLPILHALTSKSLLRVGANGRFAVHELIRQFATEKLRQNPAAWETTLARHARYYIDFMRRHIPQLKQGGKQKEALQQAELELENIRLAWRWALSQRQDSLILESAPGIYLFFTLTNRPREGHDTLRQIIDHLEESAIAAALTPAQQRLLGVAYGLLGRFLTLMGQGKQAQPAFEQGLALLDAHGTPSEQAFISMLAIPANLRPPAYQPERLYQRSLAYFEEANDRWGIANCHLKLVALWRMAGPPGNHAAQTDLLHESLALWQAIEDQRGIANTLNHLCDVAYEQGEYAAARQFASRSLAIHEELGNTLGIAHSLNHLGQVAGTTGRYADAQRYYRQSLAILRDYGNPREVAVCLDCVGYISYLLADYDTAQRCYEESLSISRELDDSPGIAWSLHNLGDLARANGRYESAKELYYESNRLHKSKDPLSWGGAVALDKLGRVTLALGEIEEAEQYFLEALSIADATGRSRETLDALFNLGRIHLQLGKQERALQILAAVINHPAVAKETLDSAQLLLTEHALSPPTQPPPPVADLSTQLLQTVPSSP